jgi:hypothetical protein
VRNRGLRVILANIVRQHSSWAMKPFGPHNAKRSRGNNIGKVIRVRRACPRDLQSRPKLHVSTCEHWSVGQTDCRIRGHSGAGSIRTLKKVNTQLLRGVAVPGHARRTSKCVPCMLRNHLIVG